MKKTKLETILENKYGFKNLTEKSLRTLSLQDIVGVVAILKAFNVSETFIKDTVFDILNDYFDFDAMRPTRVLNHDEIILITSLLDSIGIEEEVVDVFIYSSEEYLKHNNIQQYLHFIKNKLTRYTDTSVHNYTSYQRRLDRLTSIAEGYSTANYSTLKELTASIGEISTYFGDDFTYEKEEAKSLLKEAV